MKAIEDYLDAINPIARSAHIMGLGFSYPTLRKKARDRYVCALSI